MGTTKFVLNRWSESFCSHADICSCHFKRCHFKGENSLSCIITGDEMSIHHYIPQDQTTEHVAKTLNSFRFQEIQIIVLRWKVYVDSVGKFLRHSLCICTRGVQVVRYPNLFKKNYSPQEAENAVISQRNHPVDIHIFHNAHATIVWPQQTLL